MKLSALERKGEEPRHSVGAGGNIEHGALRQAHAIAQGSLIKHSTQR
jgi:hypothetical protein